MIWKTEKIHFGIYGVIIYTEKIQHIVPKLNLWKGACRKKSKMCMIKGHIGVAIECGMVKNDKKKN